MPIRIAIADDHRVVRDGLEAVLSDEPDLEVVAQAANGREAVAVARDTQPDVLLLDISMPYLNGVDASHLVLDASPDTQILCLSMHSECRFVIQMLEAGCRGFVHKDSAFKELAHAIRTVDAGKPYIGEQLRTPEVQHYLKQAPVKPDRQARALLSSREREILQLVAEGKSSKQIAQALHISLHTVNTHRQRITTKLGISGTADLTRHAIREGLASG